MPIDPAKTVYFRHTRFSTRLPKGWRYSPSHYWLAPAGEGKQRVGLTKFATRMLGEFVEHEFSVAAGDEIAPGDPLGWVEGFKALSDIYCIGEGKFLGGNPRLNEDPQLVDKDPYDAGWLYEYEGETPPDSVDVQGYVQILDATIERMLAEQGVPPQTEQDKGKC